MKPVTLVNTKHERSEVAEMWKISINVKAVCYGGGKEVVGYLLFTGWLWHC